MSIVDATVEKRYETFAELYDELFPYSADGEAAVCFLGELARDGRVLELGVGTGRIALPLRARGHRVVGIDASRKMLGELRSKDPARSLPVTLCDMVAPAVRGSFVLVYAVWNTLFALVSQEAQVRCFASVARLLAPGGAFVVEAAVPGIARRPERVVVTGDLRGSDGATLQIASHDPVEQRIEFRHIHLRTGDVKVLPAISRYAFPPEIDLMARLAGLVLEGRYADWQRTPYGAQSSRHVSVYRRPPDGNGG